MVGETLILSSGKSPVRINQIASRTIPRFLPARALVIANLLPPIRSFQGVGFVTQFWIDYYSKTNRMKENNLNDLEKFVCSCDVSVSGSCMGLPFFKTLAEETPYCVLHFPGPKGEEFSSAIKRKLDTNDFDFAGVYFPENISFFGIHFTSEVKFEQAIFASNVDFGEAIFAEDANFDRAVFKGDATFLKAQLNRQAKFNSAEFHQRAVFDSTRFGDLTLFTFAVFNGDTDFQRASFTDLVMFDFAVIKDALTFGLSRDYKHEQGFVDSSALSMSGVRIDHAENVSFEFLSLRPRWFINVDIRKFNFIEVKWIGLSKRGFDYDIRDDITDLEEGSIEFPHRVLAITYRQLAINAEDNHRYRQASIFRYLSMDVRRLENLSIRSLLNLDWWYWAASGYGEQAGRALIMLLVLIFVFGLGYLFVGFSRGPRTSESTNPTSVVDITGIPIRPVVAAFLYSSEIVTLQKPEPKPLTPCARTLVTLETILGPTQLALLALAIRRKFMR